MSLPASDAHARTSGDEKHLFKLQALHLLDFFGELAPKMLVRLDCVEAVGDQTLICRAHRATRCACRSVAG